MPHGNPTIRNGDEQSVTGSVDGELAELPSAEWAFVDQAPIGILHVARDGTVVYENERLRLATGRSDSETWLGRSLDEVAHLTGELARAVDRMMSTGSALSETRVAYSVDRGSERRFSVRGEPIRADDGVVIGACLLFVDAPAEVEVEEELRFRRVFDTVEPILRNAALSMPSEHAFLDEVARRLGTVARADQVYVLLSAEDADAYEEEVRWAREPERSLVPLRMDAFDSKIEGALGEGVLHLSAYSGVGEQDGGILTALGAVEALAVRFETAGARPGVLLLTRAAASPPWSSVEKRMIRRLGALLETLLGWMRAEERYRYVISTIEDCLVAFSFDGGEGRAFSFVTHQVELLTGRSAEDVMEGRISWIEDVVYAPDRQAVSTFERRVRAGEEARLAYRVARPDGQVRWIRESLTPRHDSAGRLVVAGILSDVTDQKAAEAALVEAKQDAEAADRLKSTFLTTISHEMRTPLAVIRGFSDLLCEELEGVPGAPGEILEFVATIQDNAARVLQLVGDLLDLSRLHTDRLPLESAPVAVAPLAHEVADRFRAELVERGIRLELSEGESDPIAIGDRGRIEQVIEIVMSNAAKFTESGRVDVSWGVSDEEVSITISDTGIGIGEDVLDQVCEPFFQEDNRLNRDFEGSGLGLALAARLMSAMGGGVEIASGRGEGTTVRIVLQRADA